LHHPLLDLACLGDLRLQPVDLRVHIGEDGRDGGLFGTLWEDIINIR
jgi:hypothetical protein